MTRAEDDDSERRRAVSAYTKRWWSGGKMAKKTQRKENPDNAGNTITNTIIVYDLNKGNNVWGQ